MVYRVTCAASRRRNRPTANRVAALGKTLELRLSKLRKAVHTAQSLSRCCTGPLTSLLPKSQETCSRSSTHQYHGRAASPTNPTIMLRTPALLRSLPTTSRAATRSAFALTQQTSQKRCAHAVSNPTLANIERRWTEMPPQEQAELWMALRDRMKTDWNQLTNQEKKAGMFTKSRKEHGCDSEMDTYVSCRACCQPLGVY